IPIKIEGTLEAYALLYIPTKAPFDLYSAEMKRGVQLYVKRIFVMDECREILQKDRQIQVIRKQLVKKILATLDEMKRDKPDDYLQFWAAFGPVLKEGLLAYDAPDKDKLLELIIAPSTHHASNLASLDDYVSRMKEGQDAIYFLTGPTREALARSPL